MADLFQVVTDKIIEQLEAGVAPWVRPWSSSGHGGMPYNAVSGKAYRGINTMLLFAPAGAAGEGWMTYKQASEVGAQVRKGERGSMIVFFKPWILEDRNASSPAEQQRTIPILRHFTVFHTSQIDNLPAKYQPKEAEPCGRLQLVDLAEEYLSKASIIHGGDRAYYSLGTDKITLPHQKQFRSTDDYYATALHELVHWTGASSRLAREYGKRFGDQAYAREELVAEMGAAFLSAKCGILGKLQHAEYIASWLAVLKADKRAVITAAGAAQKAADFVTGWKAESEEERETEAA